MGIKHPLWIVDTVIKVGTWIFQSCLFDKTVQLFVVSQIPFGIHKLLDNLPERKQVCIGIEH